MAVTVKSKAAPAAALAGALTLKVTAPAGFTAMGPVVPVMAGVVVSLTLTVCGPAVLSVTALVKVWVPLSPPTKV